MTSIDSGHALLAAKRSHRRDSMPWGSLRWAVSRERGNSEHLTVGWCEIEPGQENGRHRHPNCEEVLVVLEGRIVHSCGDQTVEMEAGDVIIIPPDVVHNARNAGTALTRLLICFSSADRQTIDE